MDLFSRRNIEDVISDIAREATMLAMRMPDGVESDRLMRKAGRDEVEANLSRWADSPELQRPT